MSSMLRSAATLPRPARHGNTACCASRSTQPALRHRLRVTLSAASGFSATPPTCTSTSPINTVVATAGLRDQPAATAAIQAASHLFYQGRPIQEQHTAMSQLQSQLAKAGLCPQQEALALLMCSGAMQSEEPESTASIQSALDGDAEEGEAAAPRWEAPVHAGTYLKEGTSCWGATAPQQPSAWQ